MSRNRDLGEFPAAALDIDASGNVGIGTSSPAYELDVNGQINIADGMNIRCEGHILIGKNTGDEIRVGSGNTTDILKLYAGGPERMRIDLDGNVGIGVTPSAWNTDTSGRTALQIGFGSISGRLNDIQSEFTNNAYATGTGNTPQYTGITRWGKNQIAMADDGVIVFNNAPTVTEAEFALSADFSWNERMRIDSVGNVGIGTSSPAAELQVSGGTQGIIISQSDTARDLGYYAQIKAPYADKSFELNVNNKKLITAGGYMNATSLMFHTDDTERMRIDSSGNLLVGTTSSPGNKFRVSSNSGNLAYLSNTAGTGVYLVSGATSWTGVSDERVKDIIEPITGAMAKFATLRTVIGKYKTDAEGIRRPFLIAQDVQSVFPEVVDIQDDEAGTLGLQYEGLIPSMIAAMKEQQKLIEALTARIEALEG